MKKRRTLLALLALGVATIAFVACNKENDDKDSKISYPKELTYKGYKIKNFEMYVGSEAGGIKVSKENSDAKLYFTRIVEEDNFVKSEVYTFYSASELYMNTELFKFTGSYKFENGRLKIYESKKDEWSNVKYGTSIERLYKELFLSKANKNNYSPITLYFTNLEEALQKSGFDKLENMTQTSDTIMWCQVEYIWE